MKLNRRTLLALALCVLWIVMETQRSRAPLEWAYVGPGAGFAFIGSFLTLAVSLVASVMSLLVWPFRVAWHALRNRGLVGKAVVRKAIFLGLDGLDPNLTERWMAEGKLPNFSRLQSLGCYHRLRTTFPALSPVAWATFATGVNPAKHNIFDFLNRDLRTYAPELSSARVHPASRYLKIGKWKLPLSKPYVEMRRKSEPFWKLLGRYSVPSTILRVPVTFPPEPFNGKLLSAMCTPDLRGTQGSFSWFSTHSADGACEGGVRAPLRVAGDALEGELRGPEQSAVLFRVELSSNPEQRILSIDGQQFVMRMGEYTPWIRLRFPIGPASAPRGIVRFLLTQLDPEVSLYATPVEIDPERPALPVSHPGHYAVYLAKLLGTFATLGMAEDTWALNEGAIDEQAFLKQARLIQEEREAMFFNALERTRRGVVACVFDSTDRVQHMFFRHMRSAEHSADPSPFADVIENLYRDVDRLVGRAVEYVDERTAFFVLSDHGFTTFRRGVNLNSWLHQNGYLALRDGAGLGGDYLEGIDWSRTRAYCFGLAGLYLNIAGREAQGIVTAEDAPALKSELIQRLTGLWDPETEQTAILNVYDSASIYRGPYAEMAPDLVPGYAPGFRASWAAATGRVTECVFENNDKRWSGDHCIDPQAVPGVLFANCTLDAADPGIEDLAPTALALFGVPKPSWMEGRSLLQTT